MEYEQWILCPICGNKTRDRVREDTLTAIADTEAGKPLANHQLDTMLEVWGGTPFTVTEYDNNLTRQLIDTIKIIGDNQLLIVFKDGRTVEQEL